MHWLAIETSSQQVSIALGDNSICLREVSKKGNASILIEPLFEELNVDFEKIQRCIIGKGPGSYNGLRVGYAFLKGLLCLQTLPIIEIPTPLILAAQATENGIVLVLNNARREEIYGALVEVQEGIPKLQWEAVSSEEALFKKVPTNICTIVSYDYTATDLLFFKEFQWVSPAEVPKVPRASALGAPLFPMASTAGVLDSKLKLSSKTCLSELEPHYVRVAVP